MADLLQDGASWLAGQLKSHVAQAVTYTRGADSVDLQATVGGLDFGVDENEEVVVDFNGKDFLITAADLVLGGVQGEPQSGDRIEWTIGTETHVFEVMAPAGLPVFRYADAYNTILRVHAKLIDVQ